MKRKEVLLRIDHRLEFVVHELHNAMNRLDRRLDRIEKTLEAAHPKLTKEQKKEREGEYNALDTLLGGDG